MQQAKSDAAEIRKYPDDHFRERNIFTLPGHGTMLSELGSTFLGRAGPKTNPLRERETMKIALLVVSLVFAGIVMASHPMSANAGQETKAAQKETKWQGTVLRISKDQSTLDIRGGATPNATETRKIAYNSSTQWTKGNKPGADMAEIKEGSFVIAVGTVDDKGVLQATRIDLRLPR